MEATDKILYFAIRARAEPIRMVYAAANQPLVDERIGLDEVAMDGKSKWSKIKYAQPLGQLPVYKCPEGTLVMSNTIARYTAKKFGLMGDTLWEEALNDMIVEACLESFGPFGTEILRWKVLKIVKVPENADQLVANAYENIMKTVKFIQSVADGRGAKYLTCDKISLADIWLFCSLEQAQLVYSDMLDQHPWLREFVTKITANTRIEKYLESRPVTPL